MTDRKLAGIYVRVSTVDQETDLQETELLEYCQRRGWEAILYRDKQLSLELSNRSQNLKRQSARWKRGVDALAQ